VWLTCKGICVLHKGLKPSDGSGRRYSAGQKRCAKCELFIKWDGLWCPCCGCRLRANPKNTIETENKDFSLFIYLTVEWHESSFDVTVSKATSFTKYASELESIQRGDIVMGSTEAASKLILY
jgi:hypothetical protein